MTIAVERLDEVVTALRTVLADDQILTSKPDRYNRARVPAPFPVHRWAERLPDLAVLPTTHRAGRRRSCGSPTSCACRSCRATAAPASPTARCRCAAGSSSTSSG